MPPLTLELLASPAMRALSLTARRLLDYLLIEHMGHAGTENGNLMATYDQLVAFGLTRRLIAPAINELVFLGLVRVHRGRMTRGGVTAPNEFRLTFYADAAGQPATNEWKGTTEEAIAVRSADRKRADRRAPQEDIEGRPTKWVRGNCQKSPLALVQDPQSDTGDDP